MKNILLPMVIVLAVVLLLLVGTRIEQSGKQEILPVVEVHPDSQGCTMDAKVCPEGSSVGRTGPNCSFAPCPIN